MRSPRAFVYVQHLLGIGHLQRAAVLARALAAQGFEATLASGGRVPPEMARALSAQGVRLVQLPPASAADLSFKVLHDETGHEIDDAWKRRRAAALLEAWRAASFAAQAQLLVLELFPFGRRQMRFELLPLLEAAASAAPRPAIACSVRDILGGLKSPARREEAIALVERYFDRVLVHGDEKVIAFERTFPEARRIARRIVHTGYVVAAAPQPQGGPGTDEVIVSAGGGAVGARLLEAAIGAKALGSLRHRTWRLLAGDNLPEADFQRLAALAASERGIALERTRADFTTLLANCALSVSQAGYNTLLETVGARARAVVVPFSGGRETEQALRARCFAERGLLEVVDETALSPQALAAAIERAARRARPAPGAIDLDGAQRSATLLAALVGEERA
jgi:predicted glycosyltransferase